jgi:hypothetical protein
VAPASSVATLGDEGQRVSDDEEPLPPSPTATAHQPAVVDLTGEGLGEAESVAVAGEGWGEAESAVVAVLTAK